MELEHVYRGANRRRGLLGELFSFTGRLGRGAFIAQSVLGLLILGTLVIIFAMVAAGFGGLNANNRNAMNVFMTPILVLAALYGINQLSGTVRRLHDIGMSGWVVLVSFAVGFNVVFMIVLCVYPSVPGPNRYGQNPHDSAADIMRHGFRFESKSKWKRAFMCYASVVEDDQFSQRDRDLALDRIAFLKDELLARNIMTF